MTLVGPFQLYILRFQRDHPAWPSHLELQVLGCPRVCSCREEPGEPFQQPPFVTAVRLQTRSCPRAGCRAAVASARGQGFVSLPRGPRCQSQGGGPTDRVAGAFWGTRKSGSSECSMTPGIVRDSPLL